MSNNNQETEYVSIFFVSRNKDNKNIEGFKERSKSFLFEGQESELFAKFSDFAKQGKPNELSRMYFSVNNRNIELANKKLVHYLIDNPLTPPHKLYQKLVSLANQKDCAMTNYWMFDFDESDEKLWMEFVNDIREYAGEDIGYSSFKTVSGFNIIVDRGFDTRELLSKWDNADLHRDGSVLVCYGTSEKITRSKIFKKEEEILK